MHTILDVKEIASFIARLNNEEEHSVGYCGTNEEEIIDTLTNEMDIEKYFVTIYENEEVIGVLGLDVDEEAKEAEIWGPFVKGDKWQEVAITMWQELLVKIPIDLSTFYGFYHKQNNRAAEFMTSLGFTRGGEHSILEVHKDEFVQGTYSHIVEELKGYTADFIALHDRCFPSTYYDGKEITERVNENQNVFLYVENDIVKGYVYVEADPEFNEGSIEFIAVHLDSQGKGIGLQLTKRAIDYLFSFNGMESVRLCVSRENETAIRLYERAGFKETKQLISFSKEM